MPHILSKVSLACTLFQKKNRNRKTVSIEKAKMVDAKRKHNEWDDNEEKVFRFYVQYSFYHEREMGKFSIIE